MDNIIFLDTETTGFKDPRMIQLAYKTDNYTFESLYNPGREIDEGATGVHGITDEDVKDKREFNKSIDQEIVQLLIDNNILVAHNASFDIRILAIEGVEVRRYIDTYQCCLKILKRKNFKGNNKLQTLKEELKLDVSGNVNVLVLEQLFLYIIDKMKGSNQEKLQWMIETSK